MNDEQNRIAIEKIRSELLQEWKATKEWKEMEIS